MYNTGDVIMRKPSLTLVSIALGAALALSSASAQDKKGYKIGYIGDLSGPMQDNYGPILEGFEYYITELNARGGINGVPVQLAARDDQLDGTRASSMVLELATSEYPDSDSPLSWESALVKYPSQLTEVRQLPDNTPRGSMRSQPHVSSSRASTFLGLVADEGTAEVAKTEPRRLSRRREPTAQRATER